jgi:RNA polymerase I specific initiation factor
MFASVNARTRYKKGLKASGTPTDGSVENSVLPKSETYLVPKVSQSLITRRIQNLTAILHLSLLRRDIKRAKRAFSILLRCERYGINLRMLWELGLEILLRSSGASKVKAEEFLGRVRLAASDIGHHPTTEKQVRTFYLCV